MKPQLFIFRGSKYVFLIVIALSLFCWQANAAPLYPHLDDLQAQISNELEALRSKPALTAGEKTQVKALSQSLQFINRRAPNLTNDLNTFYLVASKLQRFFADGRFVQTLDWAAGDYRWEVSISRDDLWDFFDVMSPSPTVNQAQTHFDAGRALLSKAYATNNPAQIGRLLFLAQRKFNTAQGLLIKLRPASTGPNMVKAKIDGVPFTATDFPYKLYTDDGDFWFTCYELKGANRVYTAKFLTLQKEGLREVNRPYPIVPLALFEHVWAKKCQTCATFDVPISGYVMLTTLTPQVGAGTFSFEVLNPSSIFAPPIKVSSGQFRFNRN